MQEKYRKHLLDKNKLQVHYLDIIFQHRKEELVHLMLINQLLRIRVRDGQDENR